MANPVFFTSTDISTASMLYESAFKKKKPTCENLFNENDEPDSNPKTYAVSITNSVLTTAIKKAIISFTIINSCLLQPSIIFCLLVRNEYSFVISIMISIAGSINK